MQEIKLIDIKKEILSENADQANEQRRRLEAKGICLVNVMASPGSGKTSVILQTIAALRASFSIGVIEGDLDSMVDSQKIADVGVPAVQIRTGDACHLDAQMLAPALEEMEKHNVNLIFVENIGNLVCPAEFDLGEKLKVMILSVPEGDDKILKYPLMFTVCDALIVNKTDYLTMPGCNFNMAALRERAAGLNPGMAVFEVSAYTGEGIAEWSEWLADKASLKKLQTRN